MPNSPDKMMTAVTESMAQRTGRSLPEWVILVQQSGVDPLDQKAVRAWLRQTHGVMQNSQWAIAFEVARQAGWAEPDVEDYIDGQYAGAKSALRPVFDRVRDLLASLGADVTVEGRSTYTPFVRRRQFAAIAPSTRTRVDLGLRYVDPPSSALLSVSDGPGQSTHKLALLTVQDVTAEVEALARAAYDQNG